LLLHGRTATFTMFSGNDVKRWPNTAAAAPPNAHQTAPSEPAPIIPPSRRRPPHR
jgi:hypothetical protein